MACRTREEWLKHLKLKADNSNHITEDSNLSIEVKVKSEFSDSDADVEDDAVEFLLQSVKTETSFTKSEGANPSGSEQERKFACTVCKKRFIKKANLIDHLKIHANIKNFECPICGKCFTQRGNMITHTRVHTQERPFK